MSLYCKMEIARWIDQRSVHKLAGDETSGTGPQAGKPTSLTGYKVWDIIRI